MSLFVNIAIFSSMAFTLVYLAITVPMVTACIVVLMGIGAWEHIRNLDLK